MCWRLDRCVFSPWLRAESVVCTWLLQLCLELLFTLVAHNGSRAQLLWPTMHDALASVMSPERTTAAGAAFNTVFRACQYCLARLQYCLLDSEDNRAATGHRSRCFMQLAVRCMGALRACEVVP